MAGFAGRLLKSTTDEATEVKLEEFDLTRFAGRLGLATAPIIAVVLGILNELGIVDVDQQPGVVAAVLGVVAFAFLAFGIVAAADILARSYADRTRGDKATTTGEGDVPGVSPRVLAQVPPGCLLWHRGDGEPVPVVAISHDSTTGKTSYLVPIGSRSARDVGTTTYKPVFDAEPRWLPQEEVTAFYVKPSA